MFSCKEKTPFLEQVLTSAETNRQELETVLTYYKDDPQKLQAAQFLIRNMLGKYTLDSMSVISNQIFFDGFELLKRENGTYGGDEFRALCNHILDSLPLSKISHPRLRKDLSFLSAVELISQIDYAFEIRDRFPWTKNIRFDDFCKYILPYKVDTYYWSEANNFFETKYSAMIDSFSNYSLTEIGEFIEKDTEKSFFLQWGIFTHEYPFLLPATFKNIIKTQVGTCLDFNAYIISASRAMGVPAVLNTIPCYGNSSHPHFWMEIVDDIQTQDIYDNKPLVYSETSKEIVNGMFHIKSILPSLDHLPEDITVQHNRTMAKIYRLNYEIFAENIDYLSKSTDIPPFFKKLELEDNTDKYIICRDIEIKLWNVNQKDDIAYLCCYDSGKWTPVCRAKVENEKALFKQMGVNVLYMAGYFSKGNIIPASTPFILTENVANFLLPNLTEEKERVTLYSKVPLKTFVIEYMSKMIGAKFKLANASDLSDSITVHSINKLPYYEDIIKIDTAALYRYVICDFEGLKDFCMAEWNVYGETVNGNEMPLQGKLGGNKGLSKYSAEQAVDNDRVSYFQNNLKNEEQYLVLDLGKPTKISHIKYNPRSDDNRIVNGEVYELYYWDKEWISLGKQEGLNNSLIYSNVPQNALLRIHNHSRGKEHRPFTYDSKQLWW